MKRSLIWIGFVITGLLVVCPVVRSETDLGMYSNTKLRISFNIPKGMNLYTPENPGPLASQLPPTAPWILVNPAFTEENVTVKASRGVSEDDVVGFKKLLDDESDIPVPKYKRLSVRIIKIGKLKNKQAVEHIFMMQGNILGKLRQITFSHKGRGLTFTCATAVDRYDKANRHFFDPIFRSMAFNK